MDFYDLLHFDEPRVLVHPRADGSFVWKGYVFHRAPTGPPESRPHPHPDIAEAEALCKSGDTIGALASINELLPRHSVQRFSGCLHAAVEAGATDIVRTLLAAGFVLNDLHMNDAVLAGNIEILSMYRDNGWNFEEPTSTDSNSLPLSAAVKHAAADRTVVQWLLDHGANPDQKGHMDETPLTFAVRYAPYDIVKMLMDHLPDGRPKNGELLHAAAVRRAGDCARMIDLVLQRTNCSVNDALHSKDIFSAACMKVTGLGRPLHHAARSGTAEAAAALIVRGADFAKLDGYGRSPIEEARNYKNEEVLQVLLKAEADANRPKM